MVEHSNISEFRKHLSNMYDLVNFRIPLWNLISSTGDQAFAQFAFALKLVRKLFNEFLPKYHTTSRLLGVEENLGISAPRFQYADVFSVPSDLRSRSIGEEFWLPVLSNEEN